MLVDDGPIWTRPGHQRALASRGTAPKHNSRLTTSNAFARLFPDGLEATNAATFAKDRHLVYRHDLQPSG